VADPALHARQIRQNCPQQTPSADCPLLPGVIFLPPKQQPLLWPPSLQQHSHTDCPCTAATAAGHLHYCLRPDQPLGLLRRRAGGQARRCQPTAACPPPAPQLPACWLE
jgi:hypothetical protein